jgi:shikimate dehydrogenase
MIKAGVIGYPISQSKSPKIHGHWLDKYGIAGSYTTIPVSPDELSVAVDRLITDGFAGFNVTIPHKQSIIPLCGVLTPTAQEIGAVNTVFIRDGVLHGDNTDAFGFTQNLMEKQPDLDCTAGPAVVLGAGGAARAILYGLQERGVPHIILINRTRAKADELAAGFQNITVVDWDKRHDALKDVNLLVNTTALGMVGQEPLHIDLAALPCTTTVYDIVYNPLMTPFLQQARQKGCPIVTGIGMLLHQARPGFQGWFGTKTLPEVTAELEQLLLQG